MIATTYTFHARLGGLNRVTIPVQLVNEMELEKGDLVSLVLTDVTKKRVNNGVV